MKYLIQRHDDNGGAITHDADTMSVENGDLWLWTGGTCTVVHPAGSWLMAKRVDDTGDEPATNRFDGEDDGGSRPADVDTTYASGLIFDGRRWAIDDWVVGPDRVTLRLVPHEEETSCRP